LASGREASLARLEGNTEASQCGLALSARQSALPQPFDAVDVEGLVSTDDGQILDQGLRDDQTVEGIAVVKGHDCHLADVGDVKRQHGDVNRDFTRC
jgi:hypothetical protein